MTATQRINDYAKANGKNYATIQEVNANTVHAFTDDAHFDTFGIYNGIIIHQTSTELIKGKTENVWNKYTNENGSAVLTVINQASKSIMDDVYEISYNASYGMYTAHGKNNGNTYYFVSTSAKKNVDGKEISYNTGVIHVHSECAVTMDITEVGAIVK